jgi:hypothetical protein
LHAFLTLLSLMQASQAQQEALASPAPQVILKRKSHVMQPCLIFPWVLKRFFIESGGLAALRHRVRSSFPIDYGYDVPLCHCCRLHRLDWRYWRHWFHGRNRYNSIASLVDGFPVKRQGSENMSKLVISAVLLAVIRILCVSYLVISGPT